jgi:hypothetical protein
MRRAVLWLVASVLVTLPLVAGCAGGGSEGEQEGGQPKSEQEGLVSGSFAGQTKEDPNTLVAIIADKPKQGEEQRGVRVYLCDSRTINEWFEGTMTGNDLALTSEAGTAKLEGSLSSGAATGTFTLDGGRSLSFEVSPARGIAGFYEISISADDRRVHGISERGARLEGKIGQQGSNGRYRVSGTITPPDGPPQDFRASIGSKLLEPGSECRAVILSGSQSAGVKKGAPSTGYTDPTSWL